MSRTLSPAVRAALDAAVDAVVYTRGVHQGTVDEICARAGVGKPALYRHLGSRDELLVDYVERRRTRRNGELLAAMDAAAAADTGPAAGRERARAAVEWFASWIESDDFRGCGFHRALQQRDEGADTLVASVRAQKAWLADLLRREAGPRAGRHLFLLVEGALAAGAYEAGIEVAADLRSLADTALAAP